MKQRTYPLFALLLVLGAVLFAPYLFSKSSVAAAPAVTSDPILEINEDSLTSYLHASATNVQDIRPTHAMRGVNVDGSLRSGSSFGWQIAGNPFGAPWAVGPDNGVRLDSGTFVVNAVDIVLPADVAWPISRSYNARQETSGASHRDSDGPMGKTGSRTRCPRSCSTKTGRTPTRTFSTSPSAQTGS